GVIDVDQVDAPGGGQDAVDQALELLPAGVGVAGVQTEAHGITALGAAHRLPQASQLRHATCHRMLPAGGVLDEDRRACLELIHGLAPVVEADLFVLVGAHVPAVHHHSGRTDLGGQVHVLLQQFAARDPDPV